MNAPKSGYIILLTLLIISLAIVLVTYLFIRGTIFVPYADVMIKREKARHLALGGIHIACAQLAVMPDRAVQNQDKEKKSPEEVELQYFLTYILPRINKWQTFDLKKDRDGINGTIKIALVSEEGKIDINKIYDFQKHTFVSGKRDWKKFLQEVVFKQIQTNVGKTGLFEAFEKFLKARQDKLNDITELLVIPEFAVFKNTLYFEPSTTKPEEKKQAIFLTDLFTLNGKDTLEPWLLSPSMQVVLGILPKELTKEVIATTAKQFKKTTTWSQDWDKLLKPLYAKELQSLPKGIDSMLSSTFEPQIFSVLAHGSVGKISQRLYAIVERIKRVMKGKPFYDIKIRKVYWL
jgi:hypothetical protein